MSLFDSVFGSSSGERTKRAPNLQIAFEAWSSKQPFFQKIPKDYETIIKIKAGDFRKIAAAAYAAGYERGQS